MTTTKQAATAKRLESPRSNMIKAIQRTARNFTSNESVVSALVGYLLHLDLSPGDYEGATQEAAYSLDLSEEVDFRSVLGLMTRAAVA